MSFSKGKFCLHFSMPLADQDWANLTASGVKLVMMPLSFADQATLQRLKSMGCKVVLRVPEGQYGDDDAARRITLQVKAAQSACVVSAVIVGVEPDTDYVLSYGEPTWGQLEAYAHRARFDNIRRALQAEGYPVISPGLKAAVRHSDGTVGRSISEDDPPAAGVRDWVMINTLPDSTGHFGWDDAQGNCVHYYAYGWEGVVDELREMIDGKWWMTLLHKPIWLAEVGIGNHHSTDLEKMRAYIAIADILLSRKNGRQHPLGQRTELLCPFVSNGDPNGQWEPYLLLKDPQCYVELGQWMEAA